MRARRDEAKLRETLPIYEDQERAWKQLVDEGFAGRLQAEERKRQRIEAEQELKGQAHTIEGARASIQQSRERIAQIESTYRQDLYSERVETLARYQTLTQEWEKQAHRNELLELKAPQEGTIKDLATHTEGAVLQPGTVLMTIVPANEPLRAEVWVDNRDRGFVHEGQKVRVKVAPYPFQKYGMVEGLVKYVSADANESQRNPGPRSAERAADARLPVPHHRRAPGPGARGRRRAPQAHARHASRRRDLARRAHRDGVPALAGDARPSTRPGASAERAPSDCTPRFRRSST